MGSPVMNTAVKIRSVEKLSDEEYLAFLDTRPSHERWQLLDGVAMMMPPPTLRHQAVARNLGFELNLHFRTTGLALSALQEIGLIVPNVERFRPECDVAVLDDGADLDTSYAARFFLAAEILSESNTDEEIEMKRQWYAAHPDNLYCLVISQTEVRVEIWSRASGWQRLELTRLDQSVELSEWKCSIPLAAVYRGTPLAG